MASTPPTPASGYRGRLAPSPTGYLHVGHARTFWTAFQRAREAGGTLVMRMEDLDPDRSRAVYAEAALDDLRWLGIRWQEGPGQGRAVRSLRAEQAPRHLPRRAGASCCARGRLFPCRCSRKDLATALAAPHERAQTGRGRREARHAATMSRSIPAPAGDSWAARRSFPAPRPANSRRRAAPTGASAFPTAK